MQHLFHQRLVIVNLLPQPPVLPCQLYYPVLCRDRVLLVLHFCRHRIKSCCCAPLRPDNIVSEGGRQWPICHWVSSVAGFCPICIHVHNGYVRTIADKWVIACKRPVYSRPRHCEPQPALPEWSKPSIPAASSRSSMADRRRAGFFIGSTNGEICGLTLFQDNVDKNVIANSLLMTYSITQS